jgi:L-alanine-DL-glutamate epimerase-like enolase superfamily enzyme
MRIENIDFFYLAEPTIKNIGDGSQDALLVRVQGGGYTGWGECEASPLVSIANWICPMSHSACRSVSDGVLGQYVDSPEDIMRLHRHVIEIGLDIAQTTHTLSGVDIALWDWLGKIKEMPVYQLIGNKSNYKRTPYASVLFGDTPEQTYQKAKRARESNFKAAKFGWGSFGKDLETDKQHIEQARKGLGDEIQLLIDAGTYWFDDVEAAIKRIAFLEKKGVLFLEEPFVGSAVHAYESLSKGCKQLALAGGEGARNPHEARHLIDYGGIKFVQIDTGRIGGITSAKVVADYVAGKGLTYINHTFTTHLALSASLQPFTEQCNGSLCEYPGEASNLAKTLVSNPIVRDKEGYICAPEAPGLGIDINIQTVQKYLIDTQIIVNGKTLYLTPKI